MAAVHRLRSPHAESRVAQLHRDLAQREYEIQVLKRELGEAASPLGRAFDLADPSVLQRHHDDAAHRLAETLAKAAQEDAEKESLRRALFTMPPKLSHLPTAFGTAAEAQAHSLQRQAEGEREDEERRLRSEILCQGLMRQRILSSQLPEEHTDVLGWQESREDRALRVREVLANAGGRLAADLATAAVRESVRRHMPVSVVGDEALEAMPSPPASTAHCLSPIRPGLRESPDFGSVSPVPQAPPTPTPATSRRNSAREAFVQGDMDAPQETVPVGVGSLIQAIRDANGYHPAVITGVAEDGAAVDVEWCADGLQEAGVPISRTRVVVTLPAGEFATHDHPAGDMPPYALPPSTPHPQGSPGLAADALHSHEAWRQVGYTQRMEELMMGESAFAQGAHSAHSPHSPHTPHTPRTPRTANDVTGTADVGTPNSRRTRRNPSRTRRTASVDASGRKRSHSGHRVATGPPERWQDSLRSDTYSWQKRARRSPKAARAELSDSHVRTPTPRSTRVNNLSIPASVRKKERDILFGTLQASSQFSTGKSTAPVMAFERKFSTPKGWPPKGYPLEREYKRQNR